MGESPGWEGWGRGGGLEEAGGRRYHVNYTST